MKKEIKYIFDSFEAIVEDRYVVVREYQEDGRGDYVTNDIRSEVRIPKADFLTLAHEMS